MPKYNNCPFCKKGEPVLKKYKDTKGGYYSGFPKPKKGAWYMECGYCGGKTGSCQTTTEAKEAWGYQE